MLPLGLARPVPVRYLGDVTQRGGSGARCRAGSWSSAGPAAFSSSVRPLCRRPRAKPASLRCFVPRGRFDAWLRAMAHGEGLRLPSQCVRARARVCVCACSRCSEGGALRRRRCRQFRLPDCGDRCRRTARACACDGAGWLQKSSDSVKAPPAASWEGRERKQTSGGLSVEEETEADSA